MRLRSNVVYKFMCQSCHAMYIGETCRNLHTRVCEHRGISAYTDNEISSPAQLSSILTHNKKTEHPISFEDFAILSTGFSQFEVLLRESLLISQLNPSLNANINSFLQQ